jgi:putative transposase
LKVREDAWDAFTPFRAFTPAVRKMLYTTNSIESINARLRRAVNARGHFQADGVVRLLWLASVNSDKRARKRATRRAQTGRRADHPAKMVEGQRVFGRCEALNELNDVYPGRLR